ncbi:MAG: M48 family metallopeptidase [Bacteroides sp.]|nr:M48 family metallopeptidase [Bacteroides sp.]MCM1413844.1 M48 family metallopeptidase [Bacteroides sp.]MCM1471047.1 M48 family metallopeptidase [Bacteroides sp.]
MIEIHRKSNARNVIARRKFDGTTSVTIPARMSIAEAQPIIDRLIEKLNNRPTTIITNSYRDGQQIDCGEIVYNFGRQSKRPNMVIAQGFANGFNIGVGTGMEWGTPSTDKTINTVVLRTASAVAEKILLGRARELAHQLGVDVREWTIGRGMRTLGTCRADGRITLSAINIFLPRHLRDYIVCHELAHRTEMNHSSRFHSLCNRYTSGREKELVAELKNFQWPIIRKF